MPHATRSSSRRFATSRAIRRTWRCWTRSAPPTMPSSRSCAIARRGSPSAWTSSKRWAAAGIPTARWLETDTRHLLADGLHRAERVLRLLGALQDRLAAGQLVDHHVLLDEDEPVEAPAAGLRLAVEAEDIEHDVALAVLVHHALRHLEAAAGDLRHHAVAHALIEVIDRERLVEHELAHHVGVVEDRDVRVLGRIERHQPQVGDGGLPGDDLVEGFLRGLVRRPGAGGEFLRVRQE